MTKNQMIQSIITDMQAARNTARAEKDAAYFNALSNKEFENADKEVRRLTIALGKAAALNNKEEASKIKNELAKVTAARDKIFAKFYTERSSVVNAVCPKCQNNGYVKGKICQCVFKKYTSRLIEQSGFIPTGQKIFDDKLLDIFKKSNPDKIETISEYKKIYDFLAQYCLKFPNTSKPNIVLCGATGTGKTFASQVLANNLMQNGFSVLYLTAFSLIQRFKSFIGNFDNTETDALFDCDLLIIDDLGTEPKIRNVTEEYLYNVINERLTHAKPFLITTNLSPNDLFTRYDQRLASRILSKEKSIVIEMKSSDLRLTK